MADANEVARNGKAYVGYDYHNLVVENDKIHMVLDAYENFGWIQHGPAPANPLGGAVALVLRRDRKIVNKAELTRLQQHFEACMDEIASLEQSKTKTATAVSIAVGLIGTAFLAGSVFAVTHEPPMVLVCILLGIPGFAGWAAPYRLFRYLFQKRAADLAPLIEEKNEELYEICEKGHALIH